MNILQFSAGPNGERNLGLGGGPNLMARQIVTADDLHIDGLYWLRPALDLTQCGAPGEAVMAANSGRYVWFVSSDHYDGTYGWAGGAGIHIGFSNDIAILPRTWREVIPHSFTGASPNISNLQLETAWPLWKVEDETDPWRLYGHAVNINGGGQHTWVFKSANLINWEMIGVSHNAGGGHAGYQRVFRNGENDYYSYGLNGQNTAGALWTSTDAETFTESTNYSGAIGNRNFGNGVGPIYTIGAQRYQICTDDSRHASLEEGQFVCACPLEEDGLELPADNSGVIRISTKIGQGGNVLAPGGYPGPKYLQSVDYAIEDGIAHIFAKRGFFADVGIVAGASYANGGGLDDQICDYYRYIIDETTARTSAPAGVRASVDGGVVSLQWYDALPQRTYRVYAGAQSDLSDKALVGDVTGVQITDTPGVTATRYYEIVTLNGGVEEQSRIVSPYVSSRSALVNEHVERALAAGAPIGTIDLDYLSWAEDVLDEIGAKSDLAFWPMLEFGHLKNESNVLSKCFCLGSTLKPRGGDLTFATSNSTYSATGWDGLPAWTASTGAAQSYFGDGRWNNIRRAENTGLTLVAAYQKSHTGVVTLLNWGEFQGYYLRNTSGNPGSCEVGIARAISVYDTDTHATTLANSTAHIIGGAITAARVTSYVEGVAGSGVDRASTLPEQLIGQKTGLGAAAYLGSGGFRSKIAVAEITAARTYTLGDNHAQFACRHLIVFTRALSDSQMATLNTRLRAGP
jgi:hypothetical protein